MSDLISRESVIKELNELRRYVPFPSSKDVFDIIMKAKAIEQGEEFNLEQILHDPENQPSQYGTVPLEWYENLENKINRIRFNVEQVIDSLSGSYDMHAIRKKLQTAVDEESLATYDKISEVKHDTE